MALGLLPRANWPCPVLKTPKPRSSCQTLTVPIAIADPLVDLPLMIARSRLPLPRSARWVSVAS